MARKTPTIGTPIVSTKWDRPVSDIEAKAYLKKIRIPVSKINLLRAKKKIKDARKKSWLKDLPFGKEISFSQADGPWQIIYGETRAGGYYTFLHLTNNKNNYNQVITYSCHEVDSVRKLFLNGEEVTFSSLSFGNATGKWANKVYLYANNVGSPSQTAQSNLISEVGSPYWTSNHKQSNRGHVYLKLIYDRELFAENETEIDFLIRGKKCYDPRSGLTVWTNNPALCIADYLTDTVYGMKISSSKIDWTTVADSANSCDDLINLKGGGTEKRYTLNAKFEANQSHEEILQQMRQSMAGNIIYSNGKWKILAGIYRTPVATLNKEDIQSPIEISTMVGNSEIFNGVKGTFIDANNGYEVTEFPTVKNSSYATIDGQERFEDIILNCTTSQSMAQRIAKIILEDIRRQITLQADFKLNPALKLDAGDNILFNFSDYGWSNKVFEVIDYEPILDPNAGLLVSLSLKEIDSNIWNWDPNADQNTNSVAPSTNLPNAQNVTAITNLVIDSGTAHLYKKKDGTIFSRAYLSWDVSTDIFVTQGGSVEIQYKKSADSNYIPMIKLDGNSSNYYFLDVEDGVEYDFRIRAVNALEATSAWTSVLNYTVLGKTQPPSNVTGLTVSFENYLNKISWNPVSDIDVREYEIRRGGTNWATATVIANLKHTNYLDNFLTAGTIIYRVKAIDTSGNYSALEAVETVTLSGPEVVNNLTAQANDNQVLLDWDEPDAGDLPIQKYKIYRSYQTPENFIGEVPGTFSSFFESVGGTYTYLVSAVDTGGNEGTAISISLTVFKPKDFVLYNEQVLDLDTGTFNNCIMSDINTDRILALINNSETWQDHFIDNGWNTFQDAIDSGNTIFAQPIPASGSWSQIVDYGVELPNSLVTLTYDENVISGGLLISGNIYTKKLIGDPWVLNSSLSVFTTESFRYLKFELIFTRVNDDDFSEIYNINTIVNVKVERDQGNDISTSSGFKTVPFNLDYIDVNNIVITPATLTGERLTTVFNYDWTAPDLDQFQVRFIDNSGTQVARNFSWTATGVIRPPV